MTLIGDAEEKVKEWVLGIALRKAAVSAAKLIVSYAVAHGISVVTTVHGIALNTTDIGAMTVAINSILKIGTNWLSVKFPKAFGWL